MQQVQAMRQDRAACGLTFPITIRCTSLADLVAELGLEAALARVPGKGFAKACPILPSVLSTGGAIALQPPQPIGSGGLAGSQTSAPICTGPSSRVFTCCHLR